MPHAVHAHLRVLNVIKPLHASGCAAWPAAKAAPAAARKRPKHAPAPRAAARETRNTTRSSRAPPAQSRSIRHARVPPAERARTAHGGAKAAAAVGAAYAGAEGGRRRHGGSEERRSRRTRTRRAASERPECRGSDCAKAGGPSRASAGTTSPTGWRSAWPTAGERSRSPACQSTRHSHYRTTARATSTTTSGLAGWRSTTAARGRRGGGRGSTGGRAWGRCHARYRSPLRQPRRSGRGAAGACSAAPPPTEQGGAPALPSPRPTHRARQAHEPAASLPSGAVFRGRELTPARTT